MLLVNILGNGDLVVKKDDSVSILKSSEQTIVHIIELILNERENISIVSDHQTIDILKSKKNSILDIVFTDFENDEQRLHTYFYVPNTRLREVVYEMISTMVRLDYKKINLDELLDRSVKYKLSIPQEFALLINSLISNVFDINGELIKVSVYNRSSLEYSIIVPVNLNKNIQDVVKYLGEQLEIDKSYETFKDVINEFTGVGE